MKKTHWLYIGLGILALLITITAQGDAQANSSPAAQQGNWFPSSMRLGVTETLTEEQINMHSTGWILATGRIPKPDRNLTDGYVGYVVPASSEKVLDILTFGLDGPMNTDISPGGDTQTETSIAINPLNSLIALGGAIDAKYTSRCNAAYWTNDGGSTWGDQCPPDPIPNRYDPGVEWSPDGTYAYYVAESMIPPSSGVGINKFWRSTNSGQTFTQYYGLNDSTTSNDRSYVWVDRTSGPSRGTIYVTWTGYDLGGTGSIDRIMVRSSTDNGITWNTPGIANNEAFIGLQQYEALAPMPSNQAQGKAYSVWLHDSINEKGEPDTTIIWGALTTDGGTSFAPPVRIDSFPPDYAIRFSSTLPNKAFRISSSPNIAADPTTGRLYAVYMGYRTVHAQAGIFLATSDNSGTTWTTHGVLFPETSQDQFLPWISVSPDGQVHLTWGDSRNDPNNVNYNWYYATSTDQGQTFSTPLRLSSADSSGSYAPPGTGAYIGDYAPHYSINGAIYATWTDNRNRNNNRNADAYFIRGTYGQGGATPTPTATPLPCTLNPDYDIQELSGTVVHGASVADLGMHCWNCTQEVVLPFSYQFYDKTFTKAKVGSNGILTFANDTYNPSNPNYSDNQCLPRIDLPYSVLPFWDSLDASNPYGGCIDCNVYVSTSGSAPNRIYNIEWRSCEPSPFPNNDVGEGAVPCNDTYGYTKRVKFEVRLYEGLIQGKNQLDVIIDDAPYSLVGASVGVQSDSGSDYSQFACNQNISGLQDKLLRFTSLPYCTPTPTPTRTNTPTRTPTNTPTRTPTNTPTNTPCPVTPTPVAGCSIQFVDVPPGSTFYSYVRCLACQTVPVLGEHIVDGYPCGGIGEPCTCANWPYFRPGNSLTRGQMAKIVSLANYYTESVGAQQYEDIPVGHTFYSYVWRLTNRGYINGYACGQLINEPCVSPNNRPYFRPGVFATRGQMAKTVLRACTSGCTPSTQHFEDVPLGSTFHTWIEMLANLDAVQGYPCGGTGEPCGPLNKPYFRPGNAASRGQIAKAISVPYYPDCQYGPSSPDSKMRGAAPAVTVTAPPPPTSTIGSTASVPVPTITATPIPTSSIVPGTPSTNTPLPPSPSAQPTSTIVVPPPWPTVPEAVPTGYAPAPVPTSEAAPVK